jgi:hypothetical protein
MLLQQTPLDNGVATNYLESLAMKALNSLDAGNNTNKVSEA